MSNGNADAEAPLLDANVDVTYQQQEPRSPRSWDSDDDWRENEVRWEEEDEREKTYRQKLPDEEGKYHDDPLWYGKTMEEIRYATELEKSNGNAASRDGDWKRANRYWKNALKGAEKLDDIDTEVRLRLNLVLGYVQRQKPDKALMHCDEVFRERLKAAAAKAPGLLVKAHYRRAEVHILGGDEAKAVRALQTVLEMEPKNSEARKQLSKLRKQEQDRRARERDLFRGKLPGGGTQAVELDDTEVAGEATSESDDFDVAPAEGYNQTFTDRQAAGRLAKSLLGENLNCRVGQPAVFRSPEGGS